LWDCGFRSGLEQPEQPASGFSPFSKSTNVSRPQIPCLSSSRVNKCPGSIGPLGGIAKTGPVEPQPSGLHQSNFFATGGFNPVLCIRQIRAVLDDNAGPSDLSRHLTATRSRRTSRVSTAL